MEKYAALARKTVETYVRTGKVIPVPTDLPEAFYRDTKGAFVTIYSHQGGRKCLRGCVGTFEPTQENIAEEIIRNAILASQKDGRFLPVKEAELPNLSYEVSILEPPERIHSSEELDPEKFGVIVTASDGRCGLLLPDIKGVDSSLQQIGIAAQKGGIDWENEGFVLWRFSVTKYKE